MTLITAYSHGLRLGYKGWMTLGDVARAYNVPIEEIVKQFGLPASTSAETQIKSLDGGTFTTSALRTWLAERVKQ